jgi:hypothetical protein
MNERLKEIYTQVCTEQNLPITLEHNSAYIMDAFADKFAELIVQECQQACINLGNSYEIKSAGQYQAELFAFAIKQHFGSVK